MKASDLMIGDLVNVNGLNLKVGAIHADEIGVFDPDFKIYWCSDDGLDRIDPIPLTEEILVKNGFVYREEEETCATDAFHHWQLDGHWFALNSTQYFRKEKKEDMPRFDVAGIAIHYVHQLQHLLRLCGIEKEIEL